MPVLSALLEEIRACTSCAHTLPLGPRPVLAGAASARLRIVGQAPGRKVHRSGVPWDDASGARLRDWLGLPPDVFYDEARVAITPMGMCYPGKAASGDLPPAAACAALWQDKLTQGFRRTRLTLLIGHYAQAHYLREARKETLTQTVQAWRDYLPQGFLPLPHPSPRNNIWLKRNPWFARELLPALRAEVRRCLKGAPARSGAKQGTGSERF